MKSVTVRILVSVFWQMSILSMVEMFPGAGLLVTLNACLPLQWNRVSHTWTFPRCSYLSHCLLVPTNLFLAILVARCIVGSHLIFSCIFMWLMRWALFHMFIGYLVSFVKWLFSSLGYISMGLLIFLLICRTSLYIQDISLCAIWIADSSSLWLPLSLC